MKFIEPGSRIMDRAWMRDHSTNDIVYTGEALLLVLLMRSKGAGRGTDDDKFVRKLMKDQNTD